MCVCVCVCVCCRDFAYCYYARRYKIALSSDDDKLVIMADGIHTLAYGHTILKIFN